ncbi:DUF2271 domain-containing protein [Niveispirillum sp. BGYR6]|uniref:DUF2271 domain-containing protein n=1 Tax=Niveispirillum sp. BGYR6 TaxID=2971249 RepID=UPI0022B96974|nr:DUF2271 domain-containing protein [Niveispirillum sp. BGYR6]MDG5496304.1 DUF2271 domain-containing protein [Niveispirillum sp. BGYR6]
MRKLLSVTLTGLVATPAMAGEMAVTVEIPRLDVAEYHRPYLAVWVEQNDQAIANLTVRYDVQKRDNEGTKWLKDMRQWWRRSGRDQTFPMDGVSGPTLPVGEHKLSFDTAKGPLAGLKPGAYALVVEAAREVGGRELLRIPFEWPAKAAVSQSVKGSSELGTIALAIKP